jgi:eukaryotic-like serine/threonine-protein kinase
MSDRSGQHLGNYRLLRLLGQGGFADVYLAEHRHLGTYAAVKVLSMRLTRDHVDQFFEEARLLARLVHPHIVRMLDFGLEGNTAYLIMEYAPHGTLRHRHPKGAPPSSPRAPTTRTCTGSVGRWPTWPRSNSRGNPAARAINTRWG